jgi:hypothetical protein
MVVNRPLDDQPPPEDPIDGFTWTPINTSRP